MKIILCLALVGVVSITTGFAQEPAEGGRHFIVLYTLGEHWDPARQAHEQVYFKEHSAHLQALRKSKKISLGGRYSDTGMLLLKATDEAEAERLIMNDVAVQNKLFTVKIFPFDEFYKGCIE